MTSLMILTVMVCCTNTTAQLKYTWPQYNDSYDCVVGVAINNTPVCTGVLFRPRGVITAANPLEQYYKIGQSAFTNFKPKDLWIYCINGVYNKNTKFPVATMTANQSGRRSHVWVKQGFSNMHSPVHDFMILGFHHSLIFPHFNPKAIRQCSVCNDTRNVDFTRSPSIAGFGFIDEKHIKENVNLEIADYAGEDVWENCDEWIPREWGRFICVRNVDNFVGIAAGAGLFLGYNLMGLGSFSLDKGNESILVFTSLSEYRANYLYFYVPPS